MRREAWDGFSPGTRCCFGIFICTSLCTTIPLVLFCGLFGFKGDCTFASGRLPLTFLNLENVLFICALAGCPPAVVRYYCSALVLLNVAPTMCDAPGIPISDWLALGEMGCACCVVDIIIVILSFSCKRRLLLRREFFLVKAAFTPSLLLDLAKSGPPPSGRIC